MLIPITEKDGRHTWVNPLHVRWVKSNRGMLGGEKPGSQIGVGDVLPIETLEEPQDLSTRMGAAISAMLGAGVLIPALTNGPQKYGVSGGVPGVSGGD